MSMPPNDLDERLRNALALPGQPAAETGAIRSVAVALPRYRARRRMALGASALCVVGLAAGLATVASQVSPTSHLAQPSVHAPGNRVALSATCVSVQLGTHQPTCVGRVEAVSEVTSLSHAGTAAAPVEGAPAFGPNNVPRQPTPTVLHATAGTRLVVSLPRRAGSRWTGVLLENLKLESQAHPPPDAAVALGVRLDRHTGRTVTVWTRTTPGVFVLEATTSASCANPAPACVQRHFVWSITFHVR
jgi:hypothetical protein